MVVGLGLGMGLCLGTGLCLEQVGMGPLLDQLDMGLCPEEVGTGLCQVGMGLCPEGVGMGLCLEEVGMGLCPAVAEVVEPQLLSEAEPGRQQLWERRRKHITMTKYTCCPSVLIHYCLVPRNEKAKVQTKQSASD